MMNILDWQHVKTDVDKLITHGNSVYVEYFNEDAPEKHIYCDIHDIFLDDKGNVHLSFVGRSKTT